ncbi:MAG: ISL3 family transposase [Candidatus Entotheonellia bacterium]
MPALQEVGVDEWAWRRGHRYGTILVDLASHRVVDLLPDRSAATLAAWLGQHPTITVVCRDRSDLYADGIRRGAPHAVQVVDRFHLVYNLRQALEAFLINHRPTLQAAAAGTAMALAPPTGPVPVTAQVLTPYVSYLIRRWRESRPDSMQLWREIRDLGYTHSARTVCRFITQLRRAADAGLPPESQGSLFTRPQGPSARTVSFAMICPAAKRPADVQTYLHQLCQMDAGIARANTLIQTFLGIVRERRGHELQAWMAEATHSGIAELSRFARGLQDDLVAITAGLTLEWSNGVTEGQIHRLKLLKRQSYGRASFALLRQHVLQIA